ncbi:MAG: hypothetical protein KBD53_10775 [Candidatus Omnitrophica bacterium]|nr:hypothetical protein [Candidatus Omnitrophota bacterium]
MRKYSKSQINNALQLLEEAAQDKRTELLSHIDGNYENIKSMFLSTSGIRHALKDAVAHGEEVIKEKLNNGQQIYKDLDKTLRAKVKDVDKRIEENPYLFIAGVGLTAAALGFLVGHRQKNEDNL